MDDKELAIRLAENDDAALGALVDRHYARIFRFLRRLSGSDEQARELTQDTLLQIRASAHGFKGRSSFSTWALRIAYRSYSRSRRIRRHEPLSDAILVSGSEIASLDRIAFESALQRLTPKLRDAFVLHALNELSVEETASVLRIPLGTAKARIARARKALQSELEQPEASSHVALETR